MYRIYSFLLFFVTPFFLFLPISMPPQLHAETDYKIMTYGDNLEFSPNLEELQTGEIQYSLETFDGPYFEDENFSAINIFDEDYANDAVIIASKMAFIVKDITPEFFNENLFISKEFTEKTVNNAEAYHIKNSYNLKVVKPSKGYMGKKITVTGIIGHTYYPDAKKANPLTPQQMESLMSFDRDLGNPSKVAVSFLHQCDKYVYNTYSVFKFFPTNDGKDTLVVHYQAVSLKTKDLWFVPKSILKRMFTSEVSEGLEFIANGLQSYGSK